MEVTLSSTVCDSTTQVKTQCEREDSALVRVPPVCRLAVPCLSSRTTSSPAQRAATCLLHHKSTGPLYCTVTGMLDHVEALP